MLGRTAAGLYWMARYMERAENLARLVEVGYRIALMPSAATGHGDEWRSTLVSAAALEGYGAKYDEITPETVTHWLLRDPDNGSSVWRCLEAARNNGRGMRTALTREMWEALNATWVEYSTLRPGDLRGDRLPDLLNWVRERSQAFRGAMLGTIIRDDGYHFSQLGAFLERADQTARILDVKYHILLPRSEMVGGATDGYQWETILRSVSARGAYRYVYKGPYRAWNVAEFLILSPRMPRSLRFSYDWITASLDGLGEVYGTAAPADDDAAATRARLVDCDMSTIFQGGLHEFLGDFIARNGALSIALARDYHFD